MKNKIQQLACYIVFVLILTTLGAHGQQLQNSDFVLFSGAGGAGTTTPVSPGYGIQYGSSSTIQGGSIGSYMLVKSTGNASVTSNIYSKGTVVLTNSNTVSGRITAANSSAVSGTILAIGSSANLGGNIDVNGNIVVGGGTVSGRVTHPAGTTYSGPTPAGGNVTGTPSLPVFPSLPPVTSFPAFANTPDIINTQTITPGSYHNIALANNKTLTFNGCGVYVFNLINNTGNASIILDFKNNPTGIFKICVHNDVNMNKLSVSTVNGGSASRIFLETHGNGSSNGTYAFAIANGSGGSHTRWLGTVWAPFAAINIGSGTGNCDITGALWSGTQVNIQSGATIIYSAFTGCTPPIADAGGDVSFCSGGSSYLGTTFTSGYNYSWFPAAGLTSASVPNPSVTLTATGSTVYTVTVSANGCSSTDQVSVTVNALPNVSEGTYSALCTSVSPITLNGTPAGGTYSGNGVIGSTFNPAIAGAGSHILTYNYTNGNGCSKSSQTTIVVNALPDAEAGIGGALTCSNPTLQLTGTSAILNAHFSWNSNNGGTFVSGQNLLNPVVNGEGTFILTVSNLSTGCANTDSVIVTRIPCIFPYYPPLPEGKSNNKIGSELHSLYYNFGTVVDTLENIFRISNDSVWIEVIYNQGQYNALLALLQSPGYGLTDLIDNGTDNLIITGKFPIARLLRLDSLPALINYVRPVFPPITFSGVANTAGDVSMKADIARSGFNVSGENVKVGVLSNSYNTILGNPAATDVVNDDLPGLGNVVNPNPVHVLLEYPFGVRSDEGRAMLQIVHDVAPKAKLDFRTGFRSAGDFAQGIKELQQDNCNVIVDDITYITEPFFQDGLVAKAVDYVTGLGTTYFSAAGNFGNKSYEGVFNAAPAPYGIVGSAHDFGGGDVFQNISLTPGVYTIVLQWMDSIYSISQTQSGTTNDFDIYLTYDNGKTLFGFNRNNIGGDPLEVLSFTVTQNTNTNLLIVRESGSGPVRFKYISFRGDPVITEFNQGTSTIVGQANAAGAIATGAVLFSNTPPFGVNTPTVASFSSIGGTLVNGVDRNKPDISAPNGGNTTVYMGGPNIDGDAFPNFFGTSAAAPHAAGVAALLMNAKNKFYNQGLAPAEVRSILQTTAVPMYGAGYDNLSGSGLVDADAAMRTFAAPTPGLIQLIVQPGITPGTVSLLLTAEGSYLTAQSQIVFRGTLLQTTMVDQNHLSATIPAFFGNPPIQIYSPPITPNGNDGGLSNSLYFFSPVKKNVVVTTDNKSKKYGEKLPDLTSTITVNGQAPSAFGLSLADLGLNSVTYNTPATSTSNTGIYFINSSADVSDIGLQELYNYSFINGLFTIEKLPLIITPKDTTLTYGDKIDGLGFNYSYDHTNIDAGDETVLLNSIETAHLKNMAEELMLVDARNFINSRGLTDADLTNLSFIASARSFVNARNFVNAVIYDTTRLVDVSPASIFNYQVDQVNGTLVNARNFVNARSFVNARGFVNGTATVNARSFINGSPVVNSSNLDSSTSNIIIVIDEEDVNAPATDTLIEMKSINMITGTTAGEWDIVPGALLSNNFNISYGLGKLTILPATLTIKAEDKNPLCNTFPSFTSIKNGYQYEDADSNVIAGGPSYTLLDNQNQIVNGIPAGGTYQIVPGTTTLKDTADYNLVYENGTFVQPALLSLTTTATQPLCNGQLGSVSVQGVGGTGAYTYSGDITSALSAGGYNYMVTDAYGCTANAPAVINAAPAILNLSVAISQPLCYGNKGSVVLTSSGGTGSYTITGDATSNLAGGTYHYTVTDGNGCSTNATAVINTAPSQLSLSGTALPLLCYGNLSTITLTPIGGTGSYIITGDATTNLVAGAYHYTVTDANNCSANSTVIVNPSPSLLTLTATPSQPQCFNQKGSVALNANGGTLPYTYTGDPKINLSANTYNYTVTDGNGCIANANAIIIAAPSLLTLTAIATQPLCFGQKGSVALVANGGTSPYTTGGSAIINLGTGTYSYTVNDAHGCTASALASIIVPSAINLTTSSTSTSCGAASGSATVVVTGGTPDYTYLWTPGNITTPTATNLSAGFYTIKVTDINGCTTTTPATVITTPVATPGVITGGISNLCNGNGKNYSIAPVSGATSYTWTVPTGATITNNQGTSITTNYGNNFRTSGTVCVRANNACGSSAYSCLAVFATPAQPGVISGSTSVCKSQASIAYSIAPVTGATSYTWTISGGAAFVGNATGASVTVKYTTATSTSVIITVKANNSCGSSTARSVTVAVNLSCREFTETESENQIEAYPNPFKDKVIINTGNNLISATNIWVYDILGKQCYPAIMQNSLDQFEIDTKGLSNGFYIIKINSGVRENVFRIVKQ